MSKVVTLRQVGAIGIIEIQNPPVNALGHAVRIELMEAVSAADENAAISAIIITGTGRTFPAGADIGEFSGPMLEPPLPLVINRIENCQKPVVAAIHGTALGGGFEIALGCHYRVADARAKIGLPEIHIGVFPGAGGTVRLPRLAGLAVTFDMMISGKPVNAGKAETLGILDAVYDDDLMDNALAFTQALIDTQAAARPTSQMTQGIADTTANDAAIADAEATLARLPKRLMAHDAILRCVANNISKSLEDALAFERENFTQCMTGEESQGLVHAFFADRLSAKVPEAGRAAPRTLATIAVIGGGTMGSGITCAALDAGFPVTMVERDTEALARGRANVAKIYERHVERGRLTEAQRKDVMARYHGTTEFADIANVDMVIEAVFERMAVKKDVFKQLDQHVRQGAVLASNTSYLDIDDIANATSRPRDVIGLHFFSPANVMKLLEIVIPSQPHDDAVATGFQLAKQLRKVPVRAGNCDGFIGNRVLGVYAAAAMHMVEDGASPYDIDRVMIEFGYPMGPFSMFDLAGGDIGWDTRKRKEPTRPPEERYVHIADRLCENGWFGQKTGRGWYRYEPGARRGQPDPEVLAIIDAERARKGITPRSFSDADIPMRYLCAMVNEGANCVLDGTALRPSDVDITKLYGYGFPRWRGGPMKWADMQGLDRILAAIQAYAQEDPHFWQPSPLLVDLVAKGNTFASLNK